ncbi:MAG: thioredoxin family protein [Sandaracinaceae bacterium]|nr:thioredoxin family protein [Sandaracinaceae bacterium]
MALLQSNGMAVGTAAPPFSLPGTDGETWSLDTFADAKVLVVVFTCNHCPYAKAAEDRLVELQRDYADRGVRLVAINPNDAERYPADGFDAMTARAKEKGFNFPYLFDETQQVARAYDAACTPDVFVFGPDRRLVYNGRIDDNWKDAGAVTRRDLRDVVDATLEGREHGLDVVASMGCSIKWKP